MFGNLFIFDYPLLTPFVTAALVFLCSIGVHKHLCFWSRAASALLFSAGVYFAVCGAMASFLLSDATPPNEARTSGWHTALSFSPAFLPSPDRRRRLLVSWFDSPAAGEENIAE